MEERKEQYKHLLKHFRDLYEHVEWFIADSSYRHIALSMLDNVKFWVERSYKESGNDG